MPESSNFSLFEQLSSAKQCLEELVRQLCEMASHGLRDQHRLDGASNYVIWKTKILVVLKKYDLEAYVKWVVVVPTDNDQKNKYKFEQGKAKRLILDGVRDHVVSHL